MSMDGRCLSGDPALAVFWGKWCGAVTEPHTVPPAQGSHSPTGSIPQPGFMPPRPGASKTALIPTTVSHKTQNSPPEIPHRLLFKQHLSPRLARQRHQNSHPPLPRSPFWRGLTTHANQKIKKYPKGRSPPPAPAGNNNSRGVFGERGRREGGARCCMAACGNQAFPPPPAPGERPRSCLQKRRLSLHLANPPSLCSHPSGALGKRRRSPLPHLPSAKPREEGGEGETCAPLIDFGERGRQPRHRQIN